MASSTQQTRAAFNLLESLALVIGGTLAAQLLEPLQKIYEKNPKKFGTKIKAALLIFGELAELTAKSPTKIDDTIINSIIEVFKQAAANNRVKV